MGKIGATEVQLRFEIDSDGRYSRLYLLDDGGVIEAGKGKLQMKGSNSVIPVKATYTFFGSDRLIITQTYGAIEYNRVGQSSDSQDLLVGTWKTQFLLFGANFDGTIEISPQHHYHAHEETHDNGKLTAQNGHWKMISKWSPTPLHGTYQVTADKPEFNLWPFGTVELKRVR